MQRVDAQSPIPSSQTQQSTPSAGQQQQQQHIGILPYGYYYPSAGALLPNAAAAAGFQFPQAVFPVSITPSVLLTPPPPSILLPLGGGVNA